MKASIESAYARCEELTRLHAKNFAYGIRLLPPAKRRSLSAVYALARRIDDVGDGDLSQAEKLKHLGFIRNSIHNLGEESADPVLIAVRDTAERYPLPLEAFEELIKGCEMDCGVVAIQTYDELVCYCRLVAGSIGRLSLAIFGASDFAAAAPLADALGVALQMTNILRDMVEDRDQMGRIYLPREDLEIYGCSGDLSCSLDGLPELIALEARRAEDWYERGLSLLPLLDRRSRACVATMAGIYRRILIRIAANPGQVLDRRVSLSTGEKVVIATRALASGRA